MLTAKLNIGKEIVGTVEIVNVTRGLARISSDYYWRVKVKPLHKPEFTKVGLVVDSYNGDAMECLQEVLDYWRQYKEGKEYAYDNHGHKVYKAEGLTLTPAEYWEKYDEPKQKAK